MTIHIQAVINDDQLNDALEAWAGSDCVLRLILIPLTKEALRPYIEAEAVITMDVDLCVSAILMPLYIQMLYHQC